MKTLFRLGDSSYAMYLYHPFVVLGFTRLIYPRIFPNINNLFLELLLLLNVVFCLSIVSVFIHEKFDKPFKKYLRNRFIKYK